MSDSATIDPTVTPAPQTQPSRPLPQWKVILHNDPINDAEVIVKRVVEFTPLSEQEASIKTLEAHKEGQALLYMTWLERAEFVRDKFSACSPPITVELERND